MCEDPAFLLRTRHGIGAPRSLGLAKLHHSQSATEKELVREMVEPGVNIPDIMPINNPNIINGKLAISNPINGKNITLKNGTIKPDLNNNTNTITAKNGSSANKLRKDEQTKECFGRSSLRRAAAAAEKPNLPPSRRHFSTFGRILKSAKGRALETNNKIHSTSFDDSTMNENEILVFPKSLVWDWPFSDDGIARGFYTEEKFIMFLPFNNGGTGEKNGSTKKFSKISECNFSWTIGLSTNDQFGGTMFWRMELEIIRNLNMLALIISREITRGGDRPKRLKRVRKVYRLPSIYDISTLTSISYDWAIVIEALRRRDVRTNRYACLKRSETLD